MTGILVDAVRHARHAPSIFNTQPWQWRIGAGTAELWADPERWLEHTDPKGRLLLLSCGAAIHHAAVVVRAQGWEVAIDRLPAAAHGPIARLRLVPSGRRRGPGPASWLRAGWWQGRRPFGRAVMPSLVATSPDVAGTSSEELAGAVAQRRTDRRAFGAVGLDERTLVELRRAVEEQGVGLHLVRRDEVALLAAVTARAAEESAKHPWRVAELARWTHRPPGSGDGVPAATAVRDAPRRVPVRDFMRLDGLVQRDEAQRDEAQRDEAQRDERDERDEVQRARLSSGEKLPGTPRHNELLRGSRAAEIAGLDVGVGSDAGATYAVLCGDGDTPVDWLRAGEGLSALLLTATVRGVASSPMSEVVETPRTREMLAELVGGRRPYLVVRLGRAAETTPPPPAPRRRPDAHLTEF
jgi:nitroreductase